MINNNINSIPISLVSWNVQGIGISKKTKHAFNSDKFVTLKEFKVSRADVIALQELQITKQTLANYATYSLPGKKSFFSSSNKKSESIAIYINDKFSIIDSTELIPGRILKVTFNHPVFDSNIDIYNIYNYTACNFHESANLLKTLENDLIFSNNPTFLLGDFNIDLFKQTKLSNVFTTFIKNANLTDLANFFANEANTWIGNGSRATSQSRIDYIFAKNFSPRPLQKFHVLVVPTSYHAILSLEVLNSSSNSSVHQFSHIKEHLLQGPFFVETFTQRLISLLKSKFLFHTLKDLKLRDDFLNID